MGIDGWFNVHHAHPRPGKLVEVRLSDDMVTTAMWDREAWYCGNIRVDVVAWRHLPRPLPWRSPNDESER